MNNLAEKTKKARASKSCSATPQVALRKIKAAREISPAALSKCYRMSIIFFDCTKPVPVLNL